MGYLIKMLNEVCDFNKNEVWVCVVGVGDKELCL